jgi:KDO2-lipid IV(A) lauroyltransferase
MPTKGNARIGQRIVRRLLRVGLRILTFLVRLAPLPAGVRIGGSVGRLAGIALVRERQRALTHLRMAYGDALTPANQERICGDCFEHLGKTLIETLKIGTYSSDKIRETISVDGEDHLEKALAEGRGVMILTGHIGNWELGGFWLGSRLDPFAVVAAPVYDAWIEQRMVRLRARHGIETIVRGRPEAPKRILSVLRRGGAVVFLIDQDTRVEGVHVPFFGREAYTPSGPARIALRTGAPVMPGCMIREADGRNRMELEPSVPLIRTGDLEADIRKNTAVWVETLERMVRRHPEQWVWMHRRWKTPKSN